MTVDQYIAVLSVLLVPWALLVGYLCYRLGRFMQHLERQEVYLAIAAAVARVRRIPQTLDRWLDRLEGAVLDEAFR